MRPLTGAHFAFALPVIAIAVFRPVTTMHLFPYLIRIFARSMGSCNNWQRAAAILSRRDVCDPDLGARSQRSPGGLAESSVPGHGDRALLSVVNGGHLEILAIDDTARTEAQRELSLVEARFQELRKRAATMRDRLSRTDIRAPLAGTVNELNIHTIGGVIGPAEILATIVPANAKLMVEIRLSPIKIEQVSTNSPARLRFSSFNQRTTPELLGTVTYIAPATIMDRTTGEMYYLGHVEVLPGELAKLVGSPMLPGMPMEVYVQTEERTVASYLARLIFDQFNRAFRER